MNNNISNIPFHRPMVISNEELDEIYTNINECIDSGMLTNNKNVRQLESIIANYYDVKYVIATCNATQGLVLALKYLTYISKTNQICTPSFAWYSSLYAISNCNLRPQFKDINKSTWTMENGNYSFALPLHTFGNTCNISSEYTLYDGAHSLGASIKDFGDATVISLAPTKIITSIEGGLILTDNKTLFDHIVTIRDKVARMSEIHAIFGLYYITKIEDVLSKKQEIFNYYKEHLNGIFQEKIYSTNYNTIGMLTDLEIPPSIEFKKYYIPLHDSVKLRNTQEVYNKIICLPSYYDVDYKEVVRRIQEYNK